MITQTRPPKFVAYIDEAGCSGDKYGKGSSHFLAIGAIVFPVADEAEVLSLFDEARKERGHSRQFRKFSENKEKDNFVLTKILSSKRVVIAQVALHKPSMAGTFLRAHHKEEYQYLIKFLLERVSWIARDAARGGSAVDNMVKLIFSEQKMYPYEEINGYLERLRIGRGRYNCSIEWPFVHPQITAEKHVNETGQHLADLVASALHMAIEPKQHNMTDDRFQRNLIPLIYKKDGKHFGLKLFPPQEIRKLKEAGSLDFAKFIP